MTTGGKFNWKLRFFIHSDDVSRTKRTIRGTKRQNRYLFATRKF